MRRRFTFLETYNSPFKPLKLKWYIGKVNIGVPYFFPRKVVNGKYVDKKIGFDFVELGWKTKWSDTDYRFEWSPIWSFVFFKWQIAVTFVAPYLDHYWECWLYYYYSTDKTKSPEERIAQCRKESPCVWTSTKDGKEETIDYYDKILKFNKQDVRDKKLKQLGI
jgi:hypothetical protein